MQAYIQTRTLSHSPYYITSQIQNIISHQTRKNTSGTPNCNPPWSHMHMLFATSARSGALRSAVINIYSSAQRVNHPLPVPRSLFHTSTNQPPLTRAIPTSTDSLTSPPTLFKAPLRSFFEIPSLSRASPITARPRNFSMQAQQPPTASGGAPNAGVDSSIATASTADVATAASSGGGEAPRVRIAVGQMTAVGDQAANFATCARLAKEAAEAGCRMLFLPECFSFIGESQAESLAAAQPLDGPLMGQYQELARSLGLWMSLGGFQEVGPDPQHIYNTHVVLDDAGRLVARYRKIHLFDVDVPNGPILMESRTTAPGNEAVVVDTPCGRLGLSTCYDLRFPELYAHLTWERGAQILAVPSAFTVITGAAHWEVLLRARAIECQSYIVAAAQAGRHNAKRESYGHALIVDPWGSVVATLADPRATGIAVAEVDTSLLGRTRERMPCGAHREKGRPAYVKSL